MKGPFRHFRPVSTSVILGKGQLQLKKNTVVFCLTSWKNNVEFGSYWQLLVEKSKCESLILEMRLGFAARTAAFLQHCSPQ